MARDIVVIGSSAGGVEMLSKLAAVLPPQVDASIFIVLHVPATSPSRLPQVLMRAGARNCAHAVDGESVVRGRIYVAPPDRHMVLRGDRVELTRGPNENGNRPSIDVLFRSAAVEYGARVTAALLTGTLDDGTAGMRTVKRCDGLTIAQDLEEATYPAMPKSAIESGVVDRVLPIVEIAKAIVEEARADAVVATGPSGVGLAEVEREIAEFNRDILGAPLGPPSGYACPECHGSLSEVHDGPNEVRYRCRVGHAHTARSLRSGQSRALDEALWTAYRVLKESADLSRRLAGSARKAARPRSALLFEERARLAEDRASKVESVLNAGLLDAPDPNDSSVDD